MRKLYIGQIELRTSGEGRIGANFPKDTCEIFGIVPGSIMDVILLEEKGCKPEIVLVLQDEIKNTSEEMMAKALHAKPWKLQRENT